VATVTKGGNRKPVTVVIWRHIVCSGDNVVMKKLYQIRMYEVIDGEAKDLVDIIEIERESENVNIFRSILDYEREHKPVSSVTRGAALCDTEQDAELSEFGGWTCGQPKMT
jgi:hypothetical protein